MGLDDRQVFLCPLLLLESHISLSSTLVKWLSTYIVYVVYDSIIYMPFTDQIPGSFFFKV